MIKKSIKYSLEMGKNTYNRQNRDCNSRKIFDAMEIPYTEKLGEVFIFDKEIAEEDNQSLLDKLKAERGV